MEIIIRRLQYPSALQGVALHGGIGGSEPAPAGQAIFRSAGKCLQEPAVDRHFDLCAVYEHREKVTTRVRPDTIMQALGPTLFRRVPLNQMLVEPKYCIEQNVFPLHLNTLKKVETLGRSQLSHMMVEARAGMVIWVTAMRR